MDKIDRAELERMLMDPDVPDSAIRPYLQIDPLESRSLQPVVVPNPARVHYPETEAAVALASLNGVDRWRRQQRYARKIRGWTGLRVVAEGDSWFQYPFLIEDVIDHLFDRWAIYCVSAAGDLLRDMARQDEITAAVVSQKPHVLLLSAGGNDVLGGGALQRYLKPFAPGLTAPQYVTTDFDDLLNASLAIYAGLIEKALTAGAGRVVLHCYDYAIAQDGRWLGRPMRSIGIQNKTLQRAIVRVLIDRFHDGLRKMARRFPERVVIADTRGCVPDSEWYDELHPTSRGFAFPARLIRIAAEGGGVEMPETPMAELPAIERVLPVADAAALEALLAADEEALIAEIGRRETILSVSPEAAGMLVLELPTGGTESVFGSFRDLGGKFVTRMNRELYDLLCGSDQDSAQQRNQLREALKLTDSALIGAITAALTAIGCPAFVAPLVATVIVKRGINPVWEETCAHWSASLEKTQPEN